MGGDEFGPRASWKALGVYVSLTFGWTWAFLIPVVNQLPEPVLGGRVDFVFLRGLVYWLLAITLVAFT